MAVRTVWTAMTIGCLGLFLAGIPSRHAQLMRLSPTLSGALAHAGLSTGTYATSIIGIDALYLSGSALIAWLILMRKPSDPMALFVSVFLVSFAGDTSPTITGLAVRHPAVDAFIIFLGAMGYVGLNGLFYLFPDGRFVPRWTWIMLAVAIAGQVPFSMPDSSTYNPNSWPVALKLPLLLTIFGTAVFAQIYRYLRVSDSRERLQTKWVVYGAVTAIVLMFVARSSDPDGLLAGSPTSVFPLLRDPILEIGFFLIPLSIAFSMLRYRLWDIDLIINRTLVYGGLTATVVGLYVLVVGYVGTVLRTGNSLGISLLATGAVAILFQPLRAHFQRGVNRLMYGDRDDPYAVLSGLGRRLEGAVAPHNALPTVVETVAQALRLPYAEIVVMRGEARVASAAYGSPAGGSLVTPLSYGAELVGELRLGLRTGEASFSPADRRLLEDLARQVGVAAYAVRLTADLQHSRERLVSAREEERRRLRRDLHDGLGPALSGFSLKIGAVRNLISSDQNSADALLAELIDDVESAVSDVRRLVYGLRPPTLDEFGLVAAIRAHAAQYEASFGGSGLRIQIDAPAELGALPAAVEVAAYRIVQEALSNVVRHAGARLCSIRLTALGDELDVEVSDDGVGLARDRHTGVGLVSLRERAEELGGSCRIESAPTQGTRVIAYLPYPKPTRAP